MPPDNNQPFFTSASVDQDLPTPYGVTEPQWINGRPFPLPWRHNGRDGGSNHQPHHCLLNRLFGRWSKKTSKLRITDLCAGGKGWVLQTSHYDDVITGAMASRVTSLTTVYSTVYSDAAQRKHQSSASLAFVRGIHRGPVNSPHKWPVMRKMFSYDDVIMAFESWPCQMKTTNHYQYPPATPCQNIWVGSRWWTYLVIWICYQRIGKPDDKTVPPSWPHLILKARAWCMKLSRVPVIID